MPVATDQSSGASARPIILVVGARDKFTREFCLEWASRDYRIVLVDTEVTWQHSLIIDHELADIRDPIAVRAAGRALAARHRITGVLTWDEYALVPAAALAADLCCPGNTVQAMTACRDKATSRELFLDAGVPSAESVRVTTRETAAVVAARIGYPVVLKPSAHGGSIGVIRVDEPAELPAAWVFTAEGAGGQGPEGIGVLVEEYLDGPEISVECVTVDGRTTALAVTRKEVGFAPYFEETGHSVTADDPLLPQVGPIAAAAVRALGVTQGVQHVELRLTVSGPRIIEVNARIGGDMIGELVRLATGLDLVRIAADVARGVRPRLTGSARGCAAIRMIYPSRSGTLAAREFPVPQSDRPQWLHRVAWQREVGEQVSVPPEGNLYTARIGYVIVTAADPDTARERLEESVGRIVLAVDDSVDRRQPELLSHSA
ncbi:ATP-grasp domain-containing protein [Nocardia alni]|uniref:ATP-grasp domain-containing protein n=1 Tax=Nocardia alni TaxID=2815723 RepID=UPI001C24EF6D|nr:ATP-grasp domain-containing protein [Nocardia alni]